MRRNAARNTLQRAAGRVEWALDDLKTGRDDWETALHIAWAWAAADVALRDLHRAERRIARRAGREPLTRPP